MPTNDLADENDCGIAPRTKTRVPVAGGVLVYKSRALGRELIGFEDVSDWDNLTDAIAARDRQDQLPVQAPVALLP